MSNELSVAKEWVGQVSIPIRYDIDGPVIGQVVELYPNGTGKCVMLDGTVDTIKLFHAEFIMNQALEYRLLVGDGITLPSIPVDGSPLGTTDYNYNASKLVRQPHDADTTAQG